MTSQRIGNLAPDNKFSIARVCCLCCRVKAHDMDVGQLGQETSG